MDDIARTVEDEGRRKSVDATRAGASRVDGAGDAPLRGAGRSLAQRATAHLKHLRESAKKAWTKEPTNGKETKKYDNDAYETSDGGYAAGSPPAATYLTRAHERTRSVDLRHVLRDLDDTIEGAACAAQLLRELRESGGDPDAGDATNDVLDLELSDVCAAHRTHLMQVTQMSDDHVFITEKQLANMLVAIEEINAVLSMTRKVNRRLTGGTYSNASRMTAPSLGSSRIRAASTAEEEERMIAEAIAQSLAIQAENDRLAKAEAALPPPLPIPAPSPAAQTLEQLLAALPTQSATASPAVPSGPPSTSKKSTEDLLADLIKEL